MGEAELKARLDHFEAKLDKLLVAVCGDIEGQHPGLQDRVSAMEQAHRDCPARLAAEIGPRQWRIGNWLAAVALGLAIIEGIFIVARAI